jgi:hypothetical protein
MKLFSIVICLLVYGWVSAQNRYELNSGWRCLSVKEVKAGGENISRPAFDITRWMEATVPGTVLTTLLRNKQVPDPFYGMNNEKIRDIYFTGNDFYTYWFVKDFKEQAIGDEQVWLQFRGVNYKCDVFLNGKKLNPQRHEGMLLRQFYNITAVLAKNGNNRLAVIVYPPDSPGNPNGGQGGDGTIAKDLTTQYTAGWDWIQPIRDRNTGIWDKVTIEKTKSIRLQNPHVVTIVPGRRLPDGEQEPAIINVSAEIINPTDRPVFGFLQYKLAGQVIRKEVKILPHTTIESKLPYFVLPHPKLWWPNNYGPQNLYTIDLQFTGVKNEILDREKVVFGVRQIETEWNSHTGSMQALVNGQKIFIKGGNWIISDAMLRFTPERYDAEIRFHRDMNLNLIRIWGGAIIERPDFYAACDRYGLLVFQDFGFSGDCNGRWTDPMKKEDQWTRRKYPDNHALMLTTMADQVKLIRNHPSLAFWCGGNEITPPEDIFSSLKDSILPVLDGTRHFFDFSNSDSMSLNTLGGNGDGPYTIQDTRTFWEHKTFPFNSEVGSVGTGDLASLERFIPKEDLVAPKAGEEEDSVWRYHRYIPYEKYTDQYGRVKDVKDFAMKAQLVNYNQYRALMEGFSSHMWDWYTGCIIWKTQNPWTALRGQMYDYYLDVNACLYGLRNGSEPLHIMMNPADSMVWVVNNGFTAQHDLMMEVKVYDVLTGKDTLYTTQFNEVAPFQSKKYFPLNGFLKALDKKDGIFVSLRLLKGKDLPVSENLYWLPGSDGNYTALQQMGRAALKAEARQTGSGRTEVKLSNDQTNPVAFFNRITLIDDATGKRILPAFYSDNYVSVLPGETKTIVIDCPVSAEGSQRSVEIYGWNVADQKIAIKK